MLDAFAPWAESSTIDRPANPLLGDQIQQMYPWRVFVHRELAAGRLPLWNPYAGGGLPLFANGQSAMLFPLNLAVVWMPADVAATLVQLAKPLLAALGTVVFLRALGARVIPAIFGGLAWAFSGPMVAWLGWPHTNALLMVPFVFWATTRWLQTPSLRTFALTAALLAVQLLGGHPETTAHMVFVLAVYAATVAVQIHNSRKSEGLAVLQGVIAPLAGWACAVAVGAALAAVQVVPLVSSIAGSVTASERGTRSLASVTLDPETALTWALPRFFGTPLAADFGPLQVLNFNESVGYVGLGVMAFAVASFYRPRRLCWAGLLALTVVSIGLAYGIPGFTELRRLPVLNYAANTRFLYMASFGLACLGALGLDACLEEHMGQPLRVAAAVLVGVGIVCLLASIAPNMLEPSGPDSFPLTASEAGAWRRTETIRTALLVVLWLVALGSLLLRRRHRLLDSGGLVLVALSVDLVAFGGGYNPTNPRELLTRVPRSIERLKAADGDGRIVGLAETLLPNTATLFELEDFRAYEPIADQRLLPFFETMDEELRSDIRSRFYLFLWKPNVSLLSLAGVRWVLAPIDDERTLTREALAANGLVLRYVDDGIDIWENPFARPHAYLASTTATVPTDSQALDWIRAHGAAGTDSVVEGALPCDTSIPRCATAAGPALEARVQTRRLVPGFMRMDVSAPAGGTLIVNDVRYPGWVATVDGQPRPILRANYLFMGIDLPPGDHEVVLEYRPTSLMIGALVSGAAIALLSLAFAVRPLREALRRPDGGRQERPRETIG